MNLQPDLFAFAYIPGWYEQLEELAQLAIPESWWFRSPSYYSIFKKQVIDYNEERSPKAAEHFHVENEYACLYVAVHETV